VLYLYPVYSVSFLCNRIWYEELAGVTQLLVGPVPTTANGGRTLHSEGITAARYDIYHLGPSVRRPSA
jgi:hypothetical protein